MKRDATERKLEPDLPLDPGERVVGHDAEGVPITVGPEWDEPAYGDAAREANPIYRRVHDLPPQGTRPRRATKRLVSLRLDPDVIAWFEAKAAAEGAPSWQTLASRALRAYMERSG